MTFYKITLIRSAIGLPQVKRGTLQSLGLRKRMRTVYHPVTPDVAGQIMRVKELVAVSTTDTPMTRQQIHEKRRPPAGFALDTSAQLTSSSSSATESSSPTTSA